MRAPRAAVALLSAIALLTIPALAGCSGAGGPAAETLVAATDVAPPTLAALTPAASPTEEPDVDSPDETDDASASPAPSSATSGDGVTGTWDGVWQNDPQWGHATGGYTLTVTQHGTSFDGTIEISGPTCVRHGAVKGTLIGRHISMGFVATGTRDVDYEGQLDGDSMSGTWTAVACTVDVTISGTWSAQRR